jgi:hypothetical protein
VISIRIALASLIAAAALLAGGSVAQHYVRATVSHRVVVANPEPCCDEVASN